MRAYLVAARVMLIECNVYFLDNVRPESEKKHSEHSEVKELEDL